MSANEMFPARAENIKITVSSRLSHLCVQPFLQPDRQFETLSSKSTCCNNRSLDPVSLFTVSSFIRMKINISTILGEPNTEDYEVWPTIGLFI